MEENWYAIEQQARDRIAEARATARSATLARGLAPPSRSRYAVGVALIRLGSWVLARGMSLPAEVTRQLAAVPSHPIGRRTR